MLNLAITVVVALAVIAFWSRWGFRVMGMLSAFLTPAEPVHARVTISRKRDRWSEWELTDEYRQLESAELLMELKADLAARDASDDEIARAYLAQLETRSRKTA